MTTDAKQSASEFLVMNAANVLMNQGRVRAVMVIVAFEPKAGSKNATVVMNPWGGSNLDQATILRQIAAGMEGEAPSAPAQPTTVQ